MITPYTDEDIERMMADTESDLAERKESFRGSAPESVREAVCAFANDLPNHARPGVILIGVNDAGLPTGLNVTDRDLGLASLCPDAFCATMEILSQSFNLHRATFSPW